MKTRAVSLYSGQSSPAIGGQILPTTIPVQQQAEQETLGSALSGFGGDIASGVLAKRNKEKEDAEMLKMLGKILRGGGPELPTGILSLPKSF